VAVATGQLEGSLMTDDEREMVFELAMALSGALVVSYEPRIFGTARHRSHRPGRSHDGGPSLGGAACDPRGAPEGSGSRAGDRNRLNRCGAERHPGACLHGSSGVVVEDLRGHLQRRA